MALRLSGQTSIFGGVSSVFKSLLGIDYWETKETLKKIHFWPGSLGAMLEYWYIVRGQTQSHACARHVFVVKEARKGFKLRARAQSTHAITKMHASAESVLKSAYRKLMLRKIARTGNKICRKHLFLARKFARWPILIFCMHAPLTMALQIYKFRGKLSSGIFCKPWNAFSLNIFNSTR